MNKNVRLNQKALAKVVENLMPRFVKFTVVKDETFGRVSRSITLTKEGTAMVTRYAEAMSCIRNPTKRKIEMFADLVTLQALDYLRQNGCIPD
jgi:aminoglycoside phosphotransferase (APT) family kinase protein